MATTKEKLASQSLMLLRAETISSFDDGTNESEVVKETYTDFVEDILSRHPWTFATMKIQLNRGSETPINEYKYAYVIPGSVLRILGMFDSSQAGAKHVREYEIQQTTEGRRLLSNEESCYIEGIFYVDESLWPGYFVHFAIFAYASLLATPITDDEDMEAKFHQLAWGTANEGERGGKFGAARNIDSQQQGSEDIQTNDIISARFS